MKNHVLYALWAVLFVVCGALGFITEPTGAVKALCVALSVLFFVPPMFLARNGDVPTRKLVRNLSALALLLAAALLVLNILSASFSEVVGTILYYILIVATSPMICSRYWALTLFLWAYLMLYCRKLLKKQ